MISGKKITHFRRDFVKSGGDLCWCVEIVRFCVITGMKSIDKCEMLTVQSTESTSSNGDQ